MRSAGAPTLSRPPGKPKDFRRPRRHRPQQTRQADLSRRDEPQARRKHGFEADRARLRFGERQPLGLDILRIVVGNHDVDDSLGERLDQRQPFFLAAQRRREFEKGAVVADVDLVQREMIDRDAAGDVEARIAWPARIAAIDSALLTNTAW